VIGVRGEKGNVLATPISGTSAKTLQSFVTDNVKRGATIVTDYHASYVGLAAKGYTHKRVNHSVGEYVNNMAHTNGIESFWASLKRGYYGIYHHMSEKHLHRYVHEFSFRHNTANFSTIDFIATTAKRMVGQRVTYKELTDA
jgi:transposase-like protein